MSALRALRRLVFGDTWVLPVGVAIVLLGGGLVVRPLLADAVWSAVGGFVLLGGVLAVLALSVRRSL
jgi:hypothetical protein